MKMSPDGAQNRANLRLVGSQRSPKEQLHKGVAEVVNAIPFPRGKPRPRLLAKTGGGVRLPLEMPRRVLDTAIDSRVPGAAEKLVDDFHRLLTVYIAQRRRKQTIQVQDTGYAA
jgi:hypothetical protein